jgi:3-dehydroquinate synthase class II
VADLRVICDHVYVEVERATRLHKGMNSQHEAYAVILEELEEFWDQVKINPKKLTEIQRTDRLLEMRKELIHTAAMCVRAINDLGL